MIKKSTKLFVIEWGDSAGDTENKWRWIEDMPKIKEHICISVGWITRETKRIIRVIPHISSYTNKHHQGCGQGIMEIPKSAIIKKPKSRHHLKHRIDDLSNQAQLNPLTNNQ